MKFYRLLHTHTHTHTHTQNATPISHRLPVTSERNAARMHPVIEWLTSIIKPIFPSYHSFKSKVDAKIHTPRLRKSDTKMYEIAFLFANKISKQLIFAYLL
jgi:hypothetical protein